MDLNEYTKKDNLVRYSFFWNEVRLIIAALSLIFGGFPIVFLLFPSGGLVSSLLTIFWIISGIAAIYLLYVWNAGGRKLFGGEGKRDLAAFAVAIISGIHLGIAGITGINIGMKVTPSVILTLVMVVAGALYLWSAWHLHKRYKASGEKLF